MTFNNKTNAVGHNRFLNQIEKSAKLTSVVQRIKDLEHLRNSGELSATLSSINPSVSALEKAMENEGGLKKVLEGQKKIREQLFSLSKGIIGMETVNATYGLPASLTVLGDIQKTITMQKNLALEALSNSYPEIGKNHDAIFTAINQNLGRNLMRALGLENLEILQKNNLNYESKLQMDSIVSKIMLGAKNSEVIKHLNFGVISKSTLEVNEPRSSYYSDPDDQDSISTNEEDYKLFNTIDKTADPTAIMLLISKLSPSAQDFFKLFIVFIFSQIVNFANGVGSNIAAPKIQEYMNLAGDKSEKEKSKEIRKLPFGEFSLLLQSNRFVTATTLNLYVNPNSKSSVISSLKFGQVVTVISVQKDWTEISYEYGDGEVISGWVFTRYLEKFRR